MVWNFNRVFQYSMKFQFIIRIQSFQLFTKVKNKTTILSPQFFANIFMYKFFAMSCSLLQCPIFEWDLLKPRPMFVWKVPGWRYYFMIKTASIGIHLCSDMKTGTFLWNIILCRSIGLWSLCFDLGKKRRNQCWQFAG
jgi:hypothetical protein